jgi:hypothetical protein
MRIAMKIREPIRDQPVKPCMHPIIHVDHADAQDFNVENQDHCCFHEAHQAHDQARPAQLQVVG